MGKSEGRGSLSEGRCPDFNQFYKVKGVSPLLSFTCHDHLLSPLVLTDQLTGSHSALHWFIVR